MRARWRRFTVNRRQRALSRFILIRNGSKGAPAGLALDVVGIQPTQRGRRVHVAALRTGPGGLRWERWPALGHPVLHRLYAAMLVRGLAQQACSVIPPSQTGALHTGQNTACAWHPAVSRHSLQASAIAPHSIACSPVGSISGTTEKSQRSSLAGMGRIIPPARPPSTMPGLLAFLPANTRLQALI